MECQNSRLVWAMRPCLKIIKRKNKIKNSYSSINIPDSFPPKDVIWFLDRDSFFGCPETHSGPVSQKLRSTDWATIIPDSYLIKFSFLLPLFVCVPVCVSKKMGSYITQNDLELAIVQRMTMNYWFSCLWSLSAGITDVSHHTQCIQGWELNSGIGACLESTLRTALHP